MAPVVHLNGLIPSGSKQPGLDFSEKLPHKLWEQSETWLTTIYFQPLSKSSWFRKSHSDPAGPFLLH